MLTKAQQDALDAAFARVGKPGPTLQVEVDKIRATTNKDELVRIYSQVQNIERPVAEAELIALVILSKLAELGGQKKEKAAHPTYRSLEQMAFFHANRERLEAQGINVDEWDDATIAAGKVLPKKSKAVRDYRHLAANAKNPKGPDAAPPVFAELGRENGAAKSAGAFRKRAIRVFVFFIGYWFFLWCTLGLYLALRTSGKNADADLATITEIITVISVVLTLFSIQKIKR